MPFAAGGRASGPWPPGPAGSRRRPPAAAEAPSPAWGWAMPVLAKAGGQPGEPAAAGPYASLSAMVDATNCSLQSGYQYRGPASARPTAMGPAVVTLGIAHFPLKSVPQCHSPEHPTAASAAEEQLVSVGAEQRPGCDWPRAGSREPGRVCKPQHRRGC